MAIVFKEKSVIIVTEYCDAIENKQVFDFQE